MITVFSFASNIKADIDFCDNLNGIIEENKIEFLDIERLVEMAMRAHKVVDDPSLEDLLTIDQWAREFVLAHC